MISTTAAPLRYGTVGAVAATSKKWGDLLQQRYDVVIWPSSWDERVNALGDISRLGIKASSGVFLDFEGGDVAPGKLASRATVGRGLAEMCTYVDEVRIPAVDVDGAWEAVADHIGRQFVAAGRPLDVLCDLTGIPRYVTLGLMGRGFRQGVLGSITFAYTEARYPEHDGPADLVFSTGEWRLMPIPGLTSELRQDAKDHVVASVGFEGERTRRVMSALDPYRLSILFPDPGVETTYARRAFERNRRLFEMFRISESEIVRAPAADAVEAWKVLSELQSRGPAGANVVLLCAGTKPHSLAIAMEGLTRQRAQVLYILPEEHRAVSVEALERHWSYRIRNYAALL